MIGDTRKTALLCATALHAGASLASARTVAEPAPVGARPPNWQVCAAGPENASVARDAMSAIRGMQRQAVDLDATWEMRESFPPTIVRQFRESGSAQSGERKGLLRVIARGDQFWAGLDSGFTDEGAGQDWMEFASFHKSAPSFIRHGRGPGATVTIATGRGCSGALLDAPFLAQVASIFVIADLEGALIEGTHAFARRSEASFEISRLDPQASASSLISSFVVDSHSTPVLSEASLRPRQPLEPVGGQARPNGVRCRISEWASINGRQVARSADRIGFMWYPNGSAPEETRTSYELRELHAAAAAPSEIVQLGEWLERGVAIVDARSGASGVIGEDEAVVAGARYRLARPLAAADVIGGQTLISLCVGQPAQVNEASLASIAGEDAADRDSPNAAASQPVRLPWRVLGAAVLAAIGGWLGAGLLFWRASILGEANPTTPRDDIDARVRRSRAGVARLWRTRRGMIALGAIAASAGLLLSANPAGETDGVVFDFGEAIIGSGGVRLSGEVALRGRADRPSTVRSITASCGCVQIRRGVSELPMGESVAIPITFDVATVGEKLVDIVALLDDGEVRRVTVRAVGLADMNGATVLSLSPGSATVVGEEELELTAIVRMPPRSAGPSREPSVAWSMPEELALSSERLRRIPAIRDRDGDLIEWTGRLRPTGRPQPGTALVAELRLDGTAAGSAIIWTVPP